MRKKLKLVAGVGLNNANYFVYQRIDGKQKRCPYYQAWKNMLDRCYSAPSLKRRSTYKGVSVCNEWLSFMTFKSWMENQDWRGKHLDKDIIKPGNKIYCPENCVFVSLRVNTILNGNKKLGEKYPLGVHKHNGLFVVQCCNVGNKRIKRSFGTSTQASNYYIKEKRKILFELSDKQENSRVSTGLKLHADLLLKQGGAVR